MEYGTGNAEIRAATPRLGKRDPQLRRRQLYHDCYRFHFNPMFISLMMCASCKLGTAGEDRPGSCGRLGMLLWRWEHFRGGYPLQALVSPTELLYDGRVNRPPISIEHESILRDTELRPQKALWKYKTRPCIIEIGDFGHSARCAQPIPACHPTESVATELMGCHLKCGLNSGDRSWRRTKELGVASQYLYQLNPISTAMIRGRGGVGQMEC
ncbi:hypothetical protein B0J13DRAFT_553685 [Dactylonectria estremocensis]|uniref:Uncharacterized protein n=1 Tax=Dactylonectria estremocensis TaxID=1079267 RepID=A0A9P9EU02_9HYPO|nr:hypothetical protein B0J13DRAFT_553685 [Dactylonectria estremocensis]